MAAYAAVAAVALLAAQQQQRNQEKAIQASQTAAEQDAQLRSQQLQDASEIESEQRQRNLRAAMASQRAAMAAGGLSSTEGSGRALLVGLTKQADLQGTAQDSGTAYRLNGIGQSLDQTRQRNLLALSGKGSGGALGYASTALSLFSR